ncbi:MAG TPA: UDP-N-acetylmuramate dehydrogenase [Candidatus Paceibacterota bacterium]
MIDKLIRNVFPEVEKKVSLAAFTTFGIGGVAPWFILVEDAEQLVQVVQKARTQKIPYYIFAGGSNVVFPDKIPKKLIICLRASRLNKINHEVKANRIEIEAGVPLSLLISLSIRNSLQGLESLSGIPGTVGGAIYGNAGAYGQSISDKLEAVLIWDGKNTRWVTKEECQFTYRSSIFKKKDWLILSARFILFAGDKKELQQKSRQIIAIRNKKYVPGIKCPGSFFKNVLVKNVSKVVLKNIPPEKIIEGKIPAGFLLESIGAKNSRQGQIFIPDFHGNLLINEGGGRASDVVKLASRLQKKVKDKFGINLEAEVQIVN